MPQKEDHDSRSKSVMKVPNKFETVPYVHCTLLSLCVDVGICLR